MAYLLVLAVLAVVFLLITGPLRAARHGRSDAGDAVAGLEAARDAKYQEIRDAEFDLATGKLSDQDHASIDGALRAEAIEILHRLDEAEAEAVEARAATADGAAEDEQSVADGPVSGDEVPSRP